MPRRCTTRSAGASLAYRSAALATAQRAQQRRIRHGVVPVYHVGRTFLFELLLAELRNERVRFANSAESLRAHEQLMALEPEQRDSGTVYKCPSGQHDDLAISLAMLAWAAQHLHLEDWTKPIFDAHRPNPSRKRSVGEPGHDVGSADLARAGRDAKARRGRGGDRCGEGISTSVHFVPFGVQGRDGSDFSHGRTPI